MELVYLWIENHKNLVDVGFHFAGSLDCQYDQRQNILTIKEGLFSLPQNFFDENISISAMVGKNQSGKSNALEVIASYYNETTRKHIKVFLIDNVIHLWCTDTVEPVIKNETSHSIKKITSIETIIYSLDILKYKPVDDYFLYFTTRYENYNILTEDISMTLEHFTMSNLLQGITENIVEYALRNGTESLAFKFEQIHIIGNPEEYIEKIHHGESLEQLKAYYKKDAGKNILLRIETLDEGKYKTLKELIERLFDCDQKQYSTTISLSELSNILNRLGDQAIELLSTHLFYFRIEDHDEKTFSDFSSGERNFILQNTFLANKIARCKDPHILILIDEPDVTLHPEWQRQYIKKLIDYHKSVKNKSLHFIITTHSPFILSDIPNPNIAFLDTDSQGYCQVFSGLADKKKTFGANIHTLLTDSFFMKNGLVGAFAKEKIEAVINFLNDKPLTSVKTIQDAMFCTDLIGEPIIKNQLIQMIEQKERQLKND